MDWSKVPQAAPTTAAAAPLMLTDFYHPYLHKDGRCAHSIDTCAVIRGETYSFVRCGLLTFQKALR